MLRQEVTGEYVDSDRGLKNIPTTHLAFYTAIWLIFFDLEFWNLTSIEFHGDSEFAIHFGI